MLANDDNESTSCRERLYSDPSISRARKLAYGIGALPKALLLTIYNVYYMPFLLNIVGITPGYVSIVVVGCKMLDALTDPFLGYLISRLPPSRFGKYRHWLLIAPPFGIVPYIMMWYIPDFSEVGQMFYYMFVYWLSAIFMTLYFVPYKSICLTLSNSQKERDSIVAYRMLSEMAGIIIGLLLMALTLYFRHAAANVCLPQAVIDLAKVTGIKIDYDNPAVREFQIEQSKHYIFGVGIACAIMIVCALCTFFGVRERYTLHNASVSKVIDMFQNYGRIIRFRPYTMLSCCFIFLTMGSALINSQYALYYNYVLHSSDLFSFIILAQYTVGFICIPIWQILTKRLGKKLAFTISMVINTVVMFFHLFLVGKIYYLALVALGIALASGGSMLIPNSMFPDCILAYTVENTHGHETLFYSINNFNDKIAIGLTQGFGTLVLQLVGYQNGACSQSDQVVLAMRILMSAFPVCTFVIALVFLYFYPINEQYRAAQQQKIRQSLGRLLSTQSLVKPGTNDTENKLHTSKSVTYGTISPTQSTRSVENETPATRKRAMFSIESKDDCTLLEEDALVQ